MKKYFNKSIFKDKSFIKMVCFTIVLLLVLVLGNSFGYVSADGGSGSVGWLNSDDYQSSSSYDPNNQWVNFVDPDSSQVTTSNLEVSYSGICEMDFGSISNVPSGFNYDNMNKYLITGSSYPSNFRVYLWEDPDNTSHCYYNSSSSNISIYLGSSTISHIYYCDIGCYGNGYELQSVTLPASIQELTCNWMSERGVYFYAAPIPTTSPCCLMTNSDLLTLSGTARLGSYAADLFNYMDGGSNNNIVNVNYLYGSAIPLSGFDNLVGTHTSLDVDSMSPENAMFADYADWYLSNYTGNITQTFKNVSVTFSSNLNDYINENLDIDDDVSDWGIFFDYTAYVDLYYVGIVDYDTVNVDVTKNFFGVGLSSDSFDTTNYYHWYCNYYFPANGHDGTSGYVMDMDNFIDNNYMWTIGLNSLFAYMEPTSDSYKTGTSDGQVVKNRLDVTLYSLLEMADDDYFVWYSDQNGFSQFKLTCTAKLLYLGDDNDVDYQSMEYTETFNLLDGSSTIDNNGMLTNYNPYTDITDETSSSALPSNSTSSNNVSASTGNVTQTVNVTNEGAKYIPSLISKLLPTSLGDTGTGLVDTFSTMVQSNGWISVMASTVPAIPSEMWTYMTNYLSITLYLLACAFVLRLILDLL